MAKPRTNRRGYAYQMGFLTGLHPYDTRSSEMEKELNEYETYWESQGPGYQEQMNRQYEKGCESGTRMRLNPNKG
jgi:hypothetical protein